MIAEHTQTATEAPVVLQCVDLCKCYNGVVQASDHINFTLRCGEVHAFLGENGAGKSTLMKMLYGIEQPDEGQMFLSGEPVVLKSPADAIAHGIGMVHQELMLIPHLTVAENITLGQEARTRSGRLKKQEASRSIRELAASYGLDIDPDALVDKLTIGQRQRVEIVKLLYRKADILIFDEPTALLTPQESDALFDVLRRLRELGKSTIFITHKLREVYQIADRMTVIRQGRIIGTTTPQETGMEKLTQMMVGKTVPTGRRRPHPIGEEEVLQVKGLSVQSRGGAAVQNVTFSIRSGEVLGVAGIEGNGQTPLAQALLGLRRSSSGSILLDGREITGRTTKQIRDAGVGSIPDDRQGMGLILSMPTTKSPMPKARCWRTGRPPAVMRRLRSPITALRPPMSRLWSAPSPAAINKKSSSPGSLTGAAGCSLPRSLPGALTSPRRITSKAAFWQRRNRAAPCCSFPAIWMS